jgi:hypothetical protein
MADKTVTGEPGGPAVITDAGTTATNTVIVLYDEDTSDDVVMDLLERCKVAIQSDYSDASS